MFIGYSEQSVTLLKQQLEAFSQVEEGSTQKLVELVKAFLAGGQVLTVSQTEGERTLWASAAREQREQLEQIALMADTHDGRNREAALRARSYLQAHQLPEVA